MKVSTALTVIMVCAIIAVVGLFTGFFSVQALPEAAESASAIAKILPL